MVILVDQEGKNAIATMVDLVLKTQGIKGQDFVNFVLKSMKMIPEPENTKEGENKGPELNKETKEIEDQVSTKELENENIEQSEK